MCAEGKCGYLKNEQENDRYVQGMTACFKQGMNLIEKETTIEGGLETILIPPEGLDKRDAAFLIQPILCIARK